ncbi:MAG: S53 family peptidase [Acidobacteriaceae bacterium]
MTISRRINILGSASAIMPLALSLLAATPAHAQMTARASRLASQAQSIAPENSQSTVEATVWLKLHNQKDLQATVSKLYQKGSPTYHHWLTTKELTQFMPTAQDLATVQRELQSRGLKVVSTDQKNLFVRVSGPAATVQSAFGVQLNRYTVKGKSVIASATEPKLSGAAAGLVAQIGGLSGLQAEPFIKQAVNPETGQPFAGLPLTSTTPNGVFFSSNCFNYGVETHTFTTAGAALPVGTYSGNRYGASPSNSQVGTLAPCGYGANEVQTAYNLKPAYQHGLDGKGQTIVIVDAYGSPTILADANAFSSINGLPQLGSSNFTVYNPQGTPAYNAGWASETTLDVEWAHAIAPGAKIALVATASNYNSDLQGGISYAIQHQLGNVISNSYGEPEIEDDANDMNTWNSLNEVAAAAGISVNFSTGDSGDYTADGLPATVSSPSNSPYATAVGGTTMGLNSAKHISFQTGWGNNYAQLYSGVSKRVLDPPHSFGFYGGAGGGESQYFPKPSWQNNLPGAGRQQPDVSALADPFTGGEIVITPNGQQGGAQYVEVYGGTSLACPIFSAIWAITNQRAGHPLGQAAPIIAALDGGALMDVTPYTSSTNVSGSVTDSSGTKFYSPNQLEAPVETSNPFYSAFYQVASGTYYAFSFGTDTSLVVAPGWDNVTGWGVPNGNGFINAAANQ